MARTASPVRLKKRATKDGGYSLYLDMNVYGERKYEFLKLHLIPEKTRLDKETNRQTLQMAETIKAQRIVEIQTGNYFVTQSSAKSTDLISFAEAQEEKRRGGTRQIWHYVIKRLKAYVGEKPKLFNDLTVRWLQGFIDNLDDGKRKLSTNKSIAAIFVTMLNAAERQGLLPYGTTRQLETPKAQPAERQFLTIEELSALSETPCSNECIKRMFLFGALTGLRLSDVESLTWTNVSEVDGHTRLTFEQQKTKGRMYHDINDQARALMGEKGDGLIFHKYSRPYVSAVLDRWVTSAGIDKHITFHCARHTFACLMLDLDVDIYTVSKLLGHTNVATTQIYARVLDKNKRAAVDKIPDIGINSK